MERFGSGNFHQYEHQLNDSVSPSQTNGCYNGQTNGIIAIVKDHNCPVEHQFKRTNILNRDISYATSI